MVPINIYLRYVRLRFFSIYTFSSQRSRVFQTRSKDRYFLRFRYVTFRRTEIIQDRALQRLPIPLTRRISAGWINIEKRM